MWTGSTITGWSSISPLLVPISDGGGTSGDRLALSSLSRFKERNLLDLRGGLDVDCVGDMSVDVDGELLLPELLILLAESVTDLDRSRFACFWRNLGSFEGGCVGGRLGDGECAGFL